MKLAIVYGIALVVMLALDFIWLSATGNTIYRPNMQSLIREKVNLLPAVGFYALFAFALAYLIILPGISGNAVNLVDLSLRAGVLGLACYATYSLTGLSIIRDWPLNVSLIDMAWGTFAAVATANATVLSLKLLGQVA